MTGALCVLTKVFRTLELYGYINQKCLSRICKSYSKVKTKKQERKKVAEFTRVRLDSGRVDPLSYRARSKYPLSSTFNG